MYKKRVTVMVIRSLHPYSHSQRRSGCFSALPYPPCE